MSVTIDEEKMAFSKQLQRAVLGHMMTNASFNSKAKTHLKDSYFVTTELGEIFNGIVAYSTQFAALAHPDPLADFMLGLFKKNYRSDLHDCVAISIQYPLALITKSLTDWIRSGIFKAHVEQAQKYYKTQQSEEFLGVMKNFMEKARDVNLEADNSYELGNYLEDFEKSLSGASSDLTTGIKEFDDALGGGLMRGEHTVLLAPLNIGKTTTLINFMVHNIKRKKDCILITHEGRPEDIINRIRQRMVMKTREEIYEALKTRDANVIKALAITEEVLQKHLCFIPHHKSGSLFIEQVVDIIRIKNEQLFAKKGKFYDMLGDDYPCKLLSQNMKGFKEFRHSTKYVYEQLQNVALEFDMHAISPVQSNRIGLQQNAHRKGDEEMLGAEFMNESIGIAQDASNIISINRSVEDRAKNIMHLHIAKTRQGPTDRTFTFTTDFSRGITHDESLGYVSKGQENHLQKERVDQILGKHEFQYHAPKEEKNPQE